MRKLKILALVHGQWSSHTVRVLAIAKALRRTDQYEIIFSGSGPYMKFVEQADFEWIDTPLIDIEELYQRIDEGVASVYYTAENYEKYFEVEKNIIEENRPDIIIRDHFRDFGGVAAKIKQIRAFDVFIQKANLSPYYHFDFRPEKVPKWMNLFPEGSLSFAARLIKKHLRKKNSYYVRKKLKQLSLNEFITINGVRADLVLFPDAEEIFKFPDADKKFCKHIGPVLVTGQYPAPAWLEEYKKDKRKKILITGGTSGRQEQINLFENTFNKKKYAIAFYSVQNKQVNDFYGCNEFDINSVLPVSDLLISHCGTGTSYLGIKHKVPILAFYDHFEQHINAVELERQDVAIKLRKNQRTKEDILSAVEKLLSNNEYNQNILNLSNSISRYNSLKLAVGYIQQGFESFKKGFAQSLTIKKQS